jgi:hypothetical protein
MSFQTQDSTFYGGQSAELTAKSAEPTAYFLRVYRVAIHTSTAGRIDLINFSTKKMFNE